MKNFNTSSVVGTIDEYMAKEFLINEDERSLGKYLISIGVGAKNKQLEIKEFESFSELADFICESICKSENVACDPDSIKKCKDSQNYFMPAILHKGRKIQFERGDDGVCYQTNVMVCDIDEIKLNGQHINDVSKVNEIFKNALHDKKRFWYTTFSSGLEKKGVVCTRMRLVIGLSEFVDDKTYAHIYKCLAVDLSAYGIIIDKACGSVNRISYYGSHICEYSCVKDFVNNEPLDVQKYFERELEDEGDIRAHEVVEGYRKQQDVGIRLNDEAIRELLSLIPLKLEYKQWLDVKMGVHHYFKGAMDGFNIFNAFSEKRDGYDGEETLLKEWNNLKLDKQNPITMGTVIKLARDLNPHGFEAWREKYPGCSEVIKDDRSNSKELILDEGIIAKLRQGLEFSLEDAKNLEEMLLEISQRQIIELVEYKGSINEYQYKELKNINSKLSKLRSSKKREFKGMEEHPMDFFHKHCSVKAESEIISGFPAFDREISLKGGKLGFVSAYTSHGKTLSLINLAISILRHNPGKTNVFFSYEEDQLDLYLKGILCIQDKLDSVFTSGEHEYKDKNGDTKKVHFPLRGNTPIEKLQDFFSDKEKYQSINPYNFEKAIRYFVDNRQRLVIEKAYDICPTIDDLEIMIRNQVEKIKNSKGEVGVFFIDYIQKVKAPLNFGSNSTEEQKIGEVAQRLADLARDLNIQIICGAQLNRESLSKNGILGITLAHLRGTGQLEQAADWIIVIYDHKLDLLAELRIKFKKKKEEYRALRNKNASKDLLNALESEIESLESEIIDIMDRKRCEKESIILKNRGGKTGQIFRNIHEVDQFKLNWDYHESWSKRETQEQKSVFGG